MMKVLVIGNDCGDYLAARELLASSVRARYLVARAASYEAGMRALLQASHDVFLVSQRIDHRVGTDLLREAFDRGCRAPILLLTEHGELDPAHLPAGRVRRLVRSELTPALLDRAIIDAIAADLPGPEAEVRPEIVPTCMYCRKVQDAVGHWHPRDEAPNRHAGARFSHGVCGECWDSVVKVQLLEMGVPIPPEFGATPAHDAAPEQRTTETEP